METKVKKSTNEVFDQYKMELLLGKSLNRILSFGYVEAFYKGSIQFPSMTVEQRNAIILLRQSMSGVISEVMKPKEYRSDLKINGFLNLATEQTDEFYKNSPNTFLYHQEIPPKD